MTLGKVTRISQVSERILGGGFLKKWSEKCLLLIDCLETETRQVEPLHVPRGCFAVATSTSRKARIKGSKVGSSRQGRLIERKWRGNHHGFCYVLQRTRRWTDKRGKRKSSKTSLQRRPGGGPVPQEVRKEGDRRVKKGGKDNTFIPSGKDLDKRTQTTGGKGAGLLK